MDAFDQDSQEFVSTNHEAFTKAGVSRRERSARNATVSILPLPAAQISASTQAHVSFRSRASKRRRQASICATTIAPLPAGEPIQQSESQTSFVTQGVGALGDSSSAHPRTEIHSSPSPAAVNSSEGLTRDDLLVTLALGGDQSAQVPAGIHATPSPLVSEITALWRMRQRWHRAEKSLVLQGKAVCRSWTGGDKDEAGKLYDQAVKGSASDPALGMALMPFLAAVERFGTERTAIEKQLRKLAQSTTLWPWVADVKGFGALNLAAVIGEAGEIANYRNPSCLWKRMGMAVIDGGRQRKVADANAALRHGYAPARRCVAYLLGDTMIKAGEGCRYRPVYDGRKPVEFAKCEAIAADPALRVKYSRTGKYAPKAHAHNRAARYMVKRVLRDLWSEARRLRRVETGEVA